ncbi:OmpW/AlkL family protein [Uliginosibacterium gangwonense]|uniref:OmpW/AlkL family protein n=1 Tax=Uliginosibacterium gangwonense TaxID=392736 RepID=UPI00036F0F84|nr:OmpW family outer membrane protein [Uliginosibacterium gangwonense]
MNRRILSTMLLLAGVCFGNAAQAEDSPWLLRVRAVDLQFDNAQSDGLPLNGTTKIEAESRWIPEFDVSYFWTKNIATELVLTYPQDIDIKVGGTKQGTIKALPPSLMVQYHFTDLGAFKPYLGVGLNYTIFTKRSNILGGAASVDHSSVGFAAQAGVDYLIDKHWSVNLDVKYIQMNTDVTVGGTKVGSVGLNPITAGIGVGYRF